MKKRFLRFWGAFLAAAVLLGSAASATSADSPEKQPEGPGGETGEGGGFVTEEPDVPEVPLPSADILPEASVSGRTVSAAVSESQFLEALEEVAGGEAVRVTVRVRSAGETDDVEAALPKEALRAMAEQSEAELHVETPAGRVTLPNQAVAASAAAGGEDVRLHLTALPAEDGAGLLEGMDVEEARIRGGSVTAVRITSGGENVSQWDGGPVTLYLPAGDGGFEVGCGYTVYQISETGDIDSYTGQCILLDGEVRIALTAGGPGIFVVLPGAVAENLGGTDPAIVVSPLFQA